jgi:hypothetical protein
MPPGAGDGIFESGGSCSGGFVMTMRVSTMIDTNNPNAIGSGGQQVLAPGVINFPTWFGHGSIFVWKGDHWMEFDYTTRKFTCTWSRQSA